MVVLRIALERILRKSDLSKNSPLTTNVAEDSFCVSTAEVLHRAKNNIAETKTRTQMDHQSEDSGMDVSLETWYENDISNQCTKRQSTDGHDDECLTETKKPSKIRLNVVSESLANIVTAENLTPVIDSSPFLPRNHENPIMPRSMTDAIPAGNSANVAVAENHAPVVSGPLFRPWISDTPKKKPKIFYRRLTTRKPLEGLQLPGPSCSSVVVETVEKTKETVQKPRWRGRPSKDTTAMPIKKRLMINARERNRLQNVTKAMNKLKSVIPIYSDNVQMTQLSTIQIASAYILGMSRMLNLDYSAEQNKPTVEECFSVITNILPYDDV